MLLERPDGSQLGARSGEMKRCLTGLFGLPLWRKGTRILAPVCYLLDSSSGRDAPILSMAAKRPPALSLTRFETTQKEKLVFRLIASVSLEVEGHRWSNHDNLYPGERTTAHKQAENGMAYTLPFFFVVLYTVGQLIDRSQKLDGTGNVSHAHHLLCISSGGSGRNDHIPISLRKKITQPSGSSPVG